jgi:methionyl aminopeptidase
LKNGWTVVTRDGKCSAHFEHTIVIVEDGCDVLTVL